MSNCLLCGEQDNHLNKPGLCWKCSIMNTRLTSALSLARTAGLPCALTLQEWYQTILDFCWKCAYCKKELNWETVQLEHFIPISMGGGTTRSNCVPACCKCNSSKRSRSINYPLGYEHVRAYLDAQGICEPWMI